MMADVEIKLAAGITTIIRPYKQSVVYSASHLEAFGGGGASAVLSTNSCTKISRKLDFKFVP